MRSKLVILLVGLLSGLLLATHPVAAQAARLLTGADIKDSSLTTADVKNGSLLKKDFKSGQLPAGPQGPAGPGRHRGTARERRVPPVRR